MFLGTFGITWAGGSCAPPPQLQDRIGLCYWAIYIIEAVRLLEIKILTGVNVGRWCGREYMALFFLNASSV